MCDFCLRVASPDRASVPCTVCNIVVHESCLSYAARAAARGICRRTACGTELGFFPRNDPQTGVGTTAEVGGGKQSSNGACVGFPGREAGEGGLVNRAWEDVRLSTGKL